MMSAGARHHLPLWPDLQGQVCGERVHGHGDVAAGHPLVLARKVGAGGGSKMMQQAIHWY